MTKNLLRSDRDEALTLISAKLHELCVVAGSHRLYLLRYLLGMAYMESCDMVRRERSPDQGEVSVRRGRSPAN